jgi:hypothetical protein
LPWLYLRFAGQKAAVGKREMIVPEVDTVATVELKQEAHSAKLMLKPG